MWKLYERSVNTERFIEFAKHLIKYQRKKVFLIVDKAKPHTCKILKQWLETNKERIELFYLPAYSPDLNLDEHINADVKYGVGSKHPKRNKEELRKATEEYMCLLDHSHEIIIKYFLAPTINYVA